MGDTSTSSYGRPQPPDQAGGMPLAEDLLSERSRAWLDAQLAGTTDETGRLRMSDSDPDLRPRIAGYTIMQRVGRGGMGTVYECQRDGSEARLAIKLISSGKYASDEERRRFMAEIAALLRLRHPHLCRLRDFGQDASASWFVMDFIDGRPFHIWQAEERPSWIRVADLLAQTCRAVAHAHRQGIIHRDLNPANIMVLKDGSPVIMDFGLARDLSSDEVLTISGSTVGTPPYMSPEQTLGTRGVVTVCSDVWGMGGVLYHALTGRPPFEGPSTHEIFTAINETEVVRPWVHARDCPKDLERIALRCLQRDPIDRYQDLDALATDLERFAAGRRVVVRLPGIIGRIHRRARRHPLPWTLGAALILVGLGFLGYAAVEQIRRWATWTVVVDARLDQGALPAGMRALDGQLKELADPPQADATGLPLVPIPGKSKLAIAGWWWFDMPGMRGGSRLDLDLYFPRGDTIEMVIDAPPTPPVEWWHHPAGWAIKASSSDLLTIAASYLDRPGALKTNPGYLLDRPAGAGYSLSLIVEVVDTRMSVQIAGCQPIIIDEPLALGGSEHRGIGLRWFGPDSRLKRLRIERLAKAELVSPLVGPDALLRHGQREAALGEYRVLATDHQGTELGAKALLRAYAITALKGVDGTEQESIYREISGHERKDVVDHADHIRAKSLWSHGETARALGVARDLVARRPDLNPILSFLADRTWQVDRPWGAEVLALLTAAPSTGSLALVDLGITDLAPIAGRRAWSVIIDGNRISDLTPLIGSGCTFLSASANRISDLGPIASLTGLTSLTLSDNRVSDLRPLAGLTQLKSVNVSNNAITSAAGLPSGVQELLFGSLVDPSDSLRKLNQLEPRAGGNPISDISSLPVAELRNLSLAETKVTDLSVLTGARQLNRIDLGGSLVRDLSPLRGLPVSDLHLTRCSAVDLATIDLPALQRLNLRGLARVDAAFLARVLPTLTILNASQSGLESWPAVDAPALADLNLSGCALRDLGGLRLASALHILVLRGCGLRQIDPALTTLPLDRLDLRDNAITSLGDLLQRPPAVVLLTGNPLSDEACEALIAAGHCLSRPDLIWQGASIQASRRKDLAPLRRVAMPLGSKRVAVYLSPELIDVTEAQRLVVASGGRLLVPEDAVSNRRLADAVSTDRPLWLGLSLLSGQVVDDAGHEPPFVSRIPATRYRGYAALPRDGGRLGLAVEGTWALCLDGLAAGLVVEWDAEW